MPRSDPPARALRRAAATLAVSAGTLLAVAPAAAQEVTIFSDNFSTLDTTKWPTRSGLTGGSVYSDSSTDGLGNSNFPTGNAFHFDTASSRAVTMQSLGLNPTLDFVTIAFSLKYETINDPTGDFQDVFPFEDIDDGDEIVVEYTTDGTNFTEIARYEDNDTSYRHWASATVNVPTAAFTSTTQFRWRQLANGGFGADNWAIDDVTVVTNPEPGTWALFGTSAAALAAWVVRRRRARRAAAAPAN